MAGNARFHNKLHRRNHHSIPSLGYPDSGSDPIASPDEPFLGDFHAIGTLSATGNLFIGGNAVFNGSLSALGDISVLETIVTVTSALSVVNTGTGPAFTVKQTGAQPIAVFLDDTESILKLKDGLAVEFFDSIATEQYALAEGLTTFASGSGSHSEGIITRASGVAAHSEGYFSRALNQASHAEGQGSVAFGWASHSEGYQTSAYGLYTHAEGLRTSAFGDYSHSEGEGTDAIGTASHSEGKDTIASGNYSHAEGQGTKVTGSASHAEGLSTLVSNNNAHAEGENTVASGQASHAEGSGSQAQSTASHAEGSSTTANNLYAHAEGQSTTASGIASHAEGKSTVAGTGSYSHAEGDTTTASGQASHAEGTSTTANNTNAHAEGNSTTASGLASHAEGESTTASGLDSHAEGKSTTAGASYAHAEGDSTKAEGQASHAQGTSSAATGHSSFASGRNSNATADSSTAIGLKANAVNRGSTVISANTNQYNSSSFGDETFNVFASGGNFLFYKTTIGDPVSATSFVVTSGGFVGINVNDPQERLHMRNGNFRMDQGSISATSSNFYSLSTLGLSGASIDTVSSLIRGKLGINTTPLSTFALHVAGGNIRVDGVDYSRPGITNFDTDGQSLFDLRSGAVGTNYNLSISEKSTNILTGPDHFLKFFGGRTGDNQAFIVVHNTDVLRFGKFDNFYGSNFGEYMRLSPTTGNMAIGYNTPFSHSFTYDSTEKLGVSGHIYCYGCLSAIDMPGGTVSMAGKTNYLQENTGIGTNRPIVRLHVDGDIIGTGRANLSGNLTVGGNTQFGDTNTDETIIRGTVKIADSDSDALVFGSNNTNYDTNLYREFADQLKTDDSLIVTTNFGVSGNTTLGNDSSDTVTVNAGPVRLVNATAAVDALEFGSGANLANLYRVSNDQLKTDDNFEVGTDLLVDGNTTLGDASTDITVIRGITRIADSSSSNGINFGFNNTDYDSNLYRESANQLKTDDSLVVTLNLGVSGNTTLGNANTDETIIRGITKVADSSNTNGILFGSGNTLYDTNLYREGVNQLKTDDSFIVTINLGVSGNTTLGNDNNDIVTINAGPVNFPSATSSSKGLIIGNDTNLYRSSADLLKTDDSLEVTNNFYLSGIGYFRNLTLTNLALTSNPVTLTDTGNVLLININGVDKAVRLYDFA